jgi:hypothetical protein
MKTQFVTDDHGKKLAVILPIKDYEKIATHYIQYLLACVL